MHQSIGGDVSALIPHFSTPHSYSFARVCTMVQVMLTAAAIQADPFLSALNSGNWQSLVVPPLPTCAFAAPVDDMDTTDLLVGIKSADTDVWSRST